MGFGWKAVTAEKRAIGQEWNIRLKNSEYLYKHDIIA